MVPRRYQVAYVIAKGVEVFSWLLILIGVAISIAFVPRTNIYIGIAGAVLSIINGLMLVFFAQLTLIFIDMENNTRQFANEIEKTNAMLSETLGAIVAKLNKLSKGDNL